MYIFNVTFVVQKDLADNFENWLKSKVAFFEGRSILVQPLRILTILDEEHLNYSLQVNLNSIDDLEQFQIHEFDNLIMEKSRLFGENVLNFETILEKF